MPVCAGKNGEQVELNLAGVKDSLGREVEPKTVPVKIDYAQMKALPPLPQVKFADGREAWRDGDFETNMGGWETKGDGGALIDRDNTTKAEGDYSLRFTSPANGAPVSRRHQAAVQRNRAVSDFGVRLSRAAGFAD